MIGPPRTSLSGRFLRAKIQTLSVPCISSGSRNLPRPNSQMSQQKFYSYYNRLFAGKDYAHEAATVATVLNRLLPAGCHEIVDVGCGTGRHAIEFARLG